MRYGTEIEQPQAKKDIRTLTGNNVVVTGDSLSISVDPLS
jgi:hypothetical protein